MKIEEVRLDEISQDPANVRKHSDRNIEAIVASLRAFGQQKPIVVDNRGIILAGNGTYEAAKRLGWETIEIHRTDLTANQAALFSIADNRTSELAEWDDLALGAVLGTLRQAKENLDVTGFAEFEIDQILIQSARIEFNDDDEPDDEQSEDDSTIPAEDMMSVSIPLTTEQEIVVKRAISLAKKHGAETSGDAIAIISKRYIDEFAT